VEAEKVQPLTAFCQVHDPRLGRLELKAKLGEDVPPAVELRDGDPVSRIISGG
jgi:hypothetical protein